MSYPSDCPRRNCLCGGVLRTPHAQVSGPCIARLRARGAATRGGLDAENGVLTSRHTGKQISRLTSFLNDPERGHQRGRAEPRSHTILIGNNLMSSSVEETGEFAVLHS